MVVAEVFGIGYYSYMLFNGSIDQLSVPGGEGNLTRKHVCNNKAMYGGSCMKEESIL